MFPPKPVPTVEIVNHSERYVLFSDGVTSPITTYFDDEGEECEYDDAVVFVAGDDAHGWWTITIPDDEVEVVLH